MSHDLNDALARISTIHQALAESRPNNSYRATTTAFTGGVALVTAWAQHWLPYENMAYLILWASAAAVCIVVVAAEMIWRSRRSQSQLEVRTTIAAVEQFIPCLVAGFLLTVVLVMFAPYETWMLPGMWGVIFSLGIFSSRRMLPAGSWIVGVYYLSVGVIVLAMTAQDPFLTPIWPMAVLFGVGQLLAAGVLYRTELNDAAKS